jgi:tetratricopeptide (TPR) repeat protein
VDELLAGRYQLVRTLGRGGMGEVVLARQLNLDRLVVVKRVTDTSSQRNVRALVEEARIAARLHHPNIVSVLDVIDDGQPLVVMEFVAGVSLRDLIEDAPDGLALEVALPIAVDLLRGLGYAHGVKSGDAIGVVHRDVKPRNVMVTFSGVTKLIDFGISRWLEGDGNWEATSISGTRGYMAPEQQRGHRIDGRADIYAVGVTLREMLTGRPPIEDTGNAPTKPREIAEPYLRTIVERACAEQPEDRFAECGELLAALEAFAAAANLALSVTQVERWTSSRFADRKAFLEHDAARPRRPKPPTSPTIPEGARELQLGTRLQLIVRVLEGEPWIAGVTERLLHRHVRAAEDRRYHLVSTAGQQRIEVTCRAVTAGFQLDAIADGSVLASVTGASLFDATREIVRALDALAVEQPSLPAEPDELAEMRRLDARSVRAYRRYCKVIDSYLTNAFANSRQLASTLEDAIAEDAEWPRVYAVLVVLYGISTPDATSTLATARARCPQDRDPRGHRLLAALDLLRRDHHEVARDALSGLFHEDPTDPLIGMLLLRQSLITQELDEAGAVARKCQQHHPDLWFGFDVAEVLYRTGRVAEGEQAIRGYAAARPENVSTVVELVRIEASALRTAEAARHAANLLSIHGEQPDHLTELFEAMIASGQLAHARRMVERMLLGSALERARGRYRMAVIAVFEGKFAAAHNSLRKAIDANRPFALESELSQCLELARVIARVVGDLPAQRRLTGELADTHANVVKDPASAAIFRHELALLDGHVEVEPHLAGLEGAARDLARTHMLRNVALVDPSLARSVVDAGFAGNEDNTASLLALGICARREGELAIARKSFETARRLWSSVLSNQASPYHAVLAQYHLASTLAELGDAEGARAHYEGFVRAWGDADRPIAEVALARKAL